MGTLISRELAQRLLEADRPDQVEAVVKDIEATYKVQWHPVGDDEANSGTIEMGAEPELQFIERITNAQDAMLELMAERNGGTPPSPREAARKWFYAGKRSLVEIRHSAGRRGSDPVRVLAERSVRIALRDSGDPKRPTIEIRDWGIGQRPDDFPRTFMSLHRGNKLTRMHLMGVYGQGGATTFAPCEFTVVASRRAKDLLAHGQADEGGITVVRHRTLPFPYKKGRYEYLRAADDQVFRLTGQDADAVGLKPHGTVVTHIAYEMPNHHQAYRLTRTGLWALLNAALFDTILPIHITGRRPVDLEGDPHAPTTGRVIIGNASNLDGLPRSPGTRTRKGETYLEFVESFGISLDNYGKVNGRVWVIGGKESTDAFVPPDQVVSYTVSGQTQGKLHQRFLQNLGLGFLAKRMVIEVNFDTATHEGKRALFPSVRERQRLGIVNELLEQRLADWLKGHDQLRALEEKARAEALAMASAKASDRLRRKVAERINRALVGHGLTSMPGGTNGNGSKPKGAKGKLWTPIDDSHLPATPTYLKVKNSPLRIPVGSARHLKVKINAKSGYIDSKGVDLIVQARGSKNGKGPVREHGRGKLQGGQVRILIGVEKGAKPRTYQVDLRLRTPKGELAGVATVDVVRPKRRKRRQGRNTGLPDIIWLKKENWPDEWSEEEVGDVLESTDKVTIRVNEDYVHLRREIEKRATATKGADPLRRVDRLKNSYMVPIATGLWLQHHERKKAEAPPGEPWLRGERQRLAIATLDSILDVEPEG